MKTSLTSLAVAAMLACAGSVQAHITFTEAAKMHQAKEKHRMLIPVRDASRETFGKGNPGESGLIPKPTRRSRKVPSYIIGNDASIFGYLFTSISEEQDPGLYELTPDGYDKVWEDEFVYTSGGGKLTTGWLNGDKLCGYSIYTFWGMIFSFDYVEINIADGTTVRSEEFDYYEQPNISTAAFSSGEGAIYGYASSPEDGSAGWFRADANTPCQPVFVRKMSDEYTGTACYSLTYNPDDDMFYGINLEQQFVRIDADGRQSVIAEVPDANSLANYITGMVYSPKENLFYWNYNTKDRDSGIYSITKEGIFSHIVSFSDGEEMTCLITKDNFSGASKPSRPEITDVSFAGGASNGTIEILLPDSYLDGTPITDDLSWYALVDGELYSENTAAPGSTVAVEFTNITDGFHNFAFYSSCNGINGSRTSKRLFIGNDTPQAPKNVILSDGKVEWDAVTESVNGGYINCDEIEYEVIIDDQSYGSTYATSLSVTLPGGDFKQYTAEVYASYAGHKSKPGYSNSLLHGDDLTLPVHFEVTEEEFELMTIIDANDDGYSWEYSYGLTALLADWIYDESPYMDDYIYLPPIKFENADKLYSLCMSMIARSCRYPDALYEVVIATKPDAESVCKTILGPQRPPYPDPTVDDVDYEHFVNVETLFSVDSPGTYYIGFHCVSPAAQMGFLVRDINITDDNITIASPAAIDDARATAADQGELSATVTFTLPTIDLNSNLLPENANLTAFIVAEDTAMVSGHPGDKMTVKVTTHQGENNITLQTKYDDYNSPKVTVTVYTGVHVPKSISSVEVNVAPDMRSATISWPAVTEAEDGGFINPATIEYDIYMLGYNQYGDQIWTLFDTCGTETSYVFNAENQDLHYLAIGSRNEAGDNGRIFWTSFLAGPPFSLPMSENFEDGYVTTTPWLSYAIDETYTASLGASALYDISPRWSDSNDYALVMYSDEDNTNGLIGIPRFSTENMEEVTIEMEVLTGSEAPDIILYGDYPDSEGLVYIGSVTDNEDDLTTVSFKLPAELNGHKWVQVYILCRFPQSDKIFVLNSISVNGTETSVSVDGINTSDKNVYGGKEEILIKGYEGCDLEVITIEGRKILQVKAETDVATLSIDKGIYIVRADSDTFKIVVR